MENLNRITNDELNNYLVKDIVLSNYKAAEVLEKYGIDYCCNGKKPLYQAIKEKNLAANEVITEIKKKFETDSKNENSFELWNLRDLADHIVSTHHEYVRSAIPSIQAHLEKITNKHGKKYQYLFDVNQIFNLLAQEMISHMQKEEQILFPLIKYIADMEHFHEKPKTHGYGTVQNPITKMEQEHDMAGNYTEAIKKLTDNYSLPNDACTTFALAYKELENFEKDLHKHIHLENNILFPRVIEIEKKLLNNN